MITRAPGKLVLSGAYSVLEGAVAVVTAVDRYAIADSSRIAEWLTPEVQAAGLRSRPWFDASALRAADRKLGLGSSAAILVASLAADVLSAGDRTDEQSLAAHVVERALAAHAAVQPLGSGIDVVASCYGRTLAVRRELGRVQHACMKLPKELYVEVWSAPEAQSTHIMLETLTAFRRAQPRLYRQRIDAQAAAAERTLEALRSNDVTGCIAALAEQNLALQALGADAGMTIVTPDVRTLAEKAADESATVLPAGAGGGDIAIFAGAGPPSRALSQWAAQLNFERLAVRLGARGVHRAEERC